MTLPKNFLLENESYTYTLPYCTKIHKWTVSFGKVICVRCKFDTKLVYPSWPLTNKV